MTPEELVDVGSHRRRAVSVTRTDVQLVVRGAVDRRHLRSTVSRVAVHVDIDGGGHLLLDTVKSRPPGRTIASQLPARRRRGAGGDGGSSHHSSSLTFWRYTN